MAFNHGKEFKMFDGAPMMQKMNDAAIASGLAFITGELEKRAWPRRVC